MKAAWIKIDPEKDDPPKGPFLIRSHGGQTWMGFTASDFYDAEYWFPMPELPNEDKNNVSTDDRR